jgi:hypothetical protein
MARHGNGLCTRLSQWLVARERSVRRSMRCKRSRLAMSQARRNYNNVTRPSDSSIIQFIVGKLCTDSSGHEHVDAL